MDKNNSEEVEDYINKSYLDWYKDRKNPEVRQLFYKLNFSDSDIDNMTLDYFVFNFYVSAKGINRYTSKIPRVPLYKPLV